MKKATKTMLLLLIALCSVLLLGGCKAGGSGGAVYDKEYRTDVGKTDIIVFRSGDRYRGYVSPTDGWKDLYADPPATVSMNDGEFLQVTADLELVDGGVSGLSNVPNIRKVYSTKAVTYADAISGGYLQPYDANIDQDLRAPRYVSDDGVIKVISSGSYNKYHVYRDGAWVGTYDTIYGADIAMGLRTSDDEVTYEAMDLSEIYLFKSGHTYYVYSSLMGHDHWTPVVNKNYERELPNYTLNDGELARGTMVSVTKMNGGTAGYRNAVKIEGITGFDRIPYQDASFVFSDWENDTEMNDGYMKAWKNGEYIIFPADGMFHVYMVNEEDCFIEKVGDYINASGVNEAIGRK